MNDHELKEIVQKLDVPPPSDGAKERAINLAKQAFAENQQKNAQSRKGLGLGVRLIGTTTLWEPLIRSFTMKKAYAVAGSFAALAVVLAVTTTHYSTIMPEAQLTAAVEKDKKSEPQKEESVVSNSAPGMSQSFVAAAPPAPPAESQAAMDMSAPGMAAGSAASPLMAKSREMRADGASVQSAMAPGMPAPAYDMVMPYPQPTYSGDKFESHAANTVKSVAQEPVSTFSIDVDTASYSFVRRMINEGQLPQPEMVRAEEMINYFDYEYALPESKAQPFKPSVSVVPAPWNKNAKLVHIGIKGFDVATKPRANLVFLIDVSGSMNQPDKLPLVKSSLKMLLDQMNPDDTIGIVTYAGYAGTALTPTKIADKQKIIAVIDQLGAGGGTAGGEGIRTAYDLAQQHMLKGGLNRVILATDGDFNVGITDPAQLTSFIEQKRETGVTLSILGFGKGNYNDALMQKLAQNGNGNAAYIDTINEARKVLVQEAGSTLFTIAKDVKIQVEFNPATVSDYRLIGYESRMLKREDFNNDAIDAGEVGAGHAVTAIYEITPAGSTGAVDGLRYGAAVKEEKPAPGNFSGEYGFLKLRYKLPNENESKLITTPISGAAEVASIEQAPADTRFATSVAAFAQLLKGDKQLSGYGMDAVAALADGARGKDTFGYRAEFVQLVRTVKTLQGGYPVPMPHCAPGYVCE